MYSVRCPARPDAAPSHIITGDDGDRGGGDQDGGGDGPAHYPPCRTQAAQEQVESEVGPEGHHRIASGGRSRMVTLACNGAGSVAAARVTTLRAGGATR